MFELRSRPRPTGPLYAKAAEPRSERGPEDQKQSQLLLSHVLTYSREIKRRTEHLWSNIAHNFRSDRVAW